MPDYLTFADVLQQPQRGSCPVVDEASSSDHVERCPWKASSDMLRDIGGRETSPRGTWVAVDEGAKPNKEPREIR